MYQHLREEATAALNSRDYDAYEYARFRMDELNDDSKEALKFFERGGKPTISEQIVNKVQDFAEGILSVRDNINEAIIKSVEGSDNKTSTDDDLTLGEKLNEATDRILDARDNISDTVAAGVDIITDRHQQDIPAEIGGSTVEWADMNPFKNKKLR